MAMQKGPWGIHPSREADPLEQLVHRAYREITRRPTELSALKQALVTLLSYLASPEGRTDHNCRVVDTFFCIRDEWEVDIDHLPSEWQRIVEDMGGALHDTVSSPKIAENFDSTPEQLLNRVKAVVV